MGMSRRPRTPTSVHLESLSAGRATANGPLGIGLRSGRRAVIEDSDRRCIWDGKRMIVDIGQDCDTGKTRVIHQCLHCGYEELDETWLRRRDESCDFVEREYPTRPKLRVIRGGAA